MPCHFDENGHLSHRQPKLSIRSITLDFSGVVLQRFDFKGLYGKELERNGFAKVVYFVNKIDLPSYCVVFNN